MNFNISGFTHNGTVRKYNQDCILINKYIISIDRIELYNQNEIVCFVADGVGGNNAGEFASKYVLTKIKENITKIINKPGETLLNINSELIELTKDDVKLNGCATTLSGLIIKDNYFNIIHSGDSEIWLLRNETFIKITNDQVLDNSIDNSPITSYFGGNENYLTLDEDIYIEESYENDIFLICSDGLFKAMKHKQVKSILKANKKLNVKSLKILENCLNQGAIDNVSVILIERKA